LKTKKSLDANRLQAVNNPQPAALLQLAQIRIRRIADGGSRHSLWIGIEIE